MVYCSIVTDEWVLYERQDDDQCTQKIMFNDKSAVHSIPGPISNYLLFQFKIPMTLSFQHRHSSAS
jgi:hypothetical protein